MALYAPSKQPLVAEKRVLEAALWQRQGFGTIGAVQRPNVGAVEQMMAEIVVLVALVVSRPNVGAVGRVRVVTVALIAQRPNVEAVGRVQVVTVAQRPSVWTDGERYRVVLRDRRCPRLHRGLVGGSVRWIGWMLRLRILRRHRRDRDPYRHLIGGGFHPSFGEEKKKA